MPKSKIDHPQYHPVQFKALPRREQRAADARTVWKNGVKVFKR